MWLDRGQFHRQAIILVPERLDLCDGTGDSGNGSDHAGLFAGKDLDGIVGLERDSSAEGGRWRKFQLKKGKNVVEGWINSLEAFGWNVDMEDGTIIDRASPFGLSLCIWLSYK